MIKNPLEIVNSTGESIKNIGILANYLIHPGMILKAAWDFTIYVSFWVCLFTCLISLILYGLGNKKCARYAPTSIALYVLIRMIESEI